MLRLLRNVGRTILTVLVLIVIALLINTCSTRGKVTTCYLKQQQQQQNETRTTKDFYNKLEELEKSVHNLPAKFIYKSAKGNQFYLKVNVNLFSVKLKQLNKYFYRV